MTCRSASNCEAVGGWFYQNTPNVSRTLAEHWNGSKWTIQKTPNPASGTYAALSSVACPGNSDCYAVGGYLRGSNQRPIALHWNGSKWRAEMVSLPSAAASTYLSAITCPSTAECIAVGEYETSARQNRSLVEHWNGSKWSHQVPVIPSAKDSYLDGVSCLSKKLCFAVGVEEDNSSQYLNIAEQWNGTKWNTEPASSPSGANSSDLNAVACHPASSCVAVGYTTNDSGTVEKTLAQRWNGTRWKLSLPANRFTATPAFNQLSGVACPRTSSCTAVGVYELSSQADVTLAEHWNGNKWTLVKTPHPAGALGSILAAVACTSTSSCVAVGQSRSGTKITVYSALAEHWNGSKWTLMKTPKP